MPAKRYLNLPAAVGIGLLPDIPLGRYGYIDNGSLEGAALCLLSCEFADEVARYLTRVRPPRLHGRIRGRLVPAPYQPRLAAHGIGAAAYGIFMVSSNATSTWVVFPASMTTGPGSPGVVL